MIHLILLVLLSCSWAQSPDVIEGSTLFEKEKPTSLSIKRKISRPHIEPSNLPAYYHNLHLGSDSTESASVYPENTFKEFLSSLKPGTLLKAQILHSVIAFPEEKSPVIALVTEGKWKNSKLIGFSRLESNSKRIFIDFEIISPLLKFHSFTLKAVALTDSGTQGFEGTYHSQEIKYWSSDMISTFISAYFDAQVPRYLSPFGGKVEDNSLDSATKKAFSQSALSSAERFREKLKHTPEFSDLTGPLSIQILILATPQEI